MLKPEEIASPERKIKHTRRSEEDVDKPLTMRQRLSYLAILAGAGVAIAVPFVGNALFKPSDKEIKNAYAKAFKPTTEKIGRQALRLSQGPNAIFEMSPRSRFRRTHISATVPNQYGNEARVVIEMGQTNGRPDPRKVSSIFMQQPQGGGNTATVKTIKVTAPKNVTPDVFGEKAAWSGEEREFTAFMGLQQGQDRFIEGTTPPSEYPDFLGNLTNGLWFDYDSEMGEAQHVADDAERMFTQIETGVRHAPAQNQQ